MIDSPGVLGRTVRQPVDQLETFAAPPGLERVQLTAHEFTSLCPVTGQPDFGEVDIVYQPREWCLESKSLKLWLWGFREQGAFCESLATRIAGQVMGDVQPAWVEVTVWQASRGGVRTHSTARLPLPRPQGGFSHE